MNYIVSPHWLVQDSKSQISVSMHTRPNIWNCRVSGYPGCRYRTPGGWITLCRSSLLSEGLPWWWLFEYLKDVGKNLRGGESGSLEAEDKPWRGPVIFFRWLHISHFTDFSFAVFISIFASVLVVNLRSCHDLRAATLLNVAKPKSLLRIHRSQ
jgi:hypothetical protein